MARRPRLFAPGLLYHVIARGNQRQPTFLTDADYEAYLTRLVQYQKRYRVSLYAYCLMPNHVHLLAQTSEAPLSKFMQGLQQSYTQRFNKIYAKVGHLFQGRYKAIICERDEYLAALIRYIHLNPVRAGLVASPEAYPYSGHRIYLGADTMGLIEPRAVLAMFGGRAAYQRFVLAGIGIGHEERYYQTEAQQFLGAPGFAQKFGQSAAQSLATATKEPLSVVVKGLASRLGLTHDILRSPDRSPSISRTRSALGFLLVRRLGYRISDVAAAFDRDTATISVMVSRMARRLESDGPPAADVAWLLKCLEVKA